MNQESNSTMRFVSGHSRAQWVTFFMVLCIVLDVIAVISTSYQIGLLSKVMAGQTVTQAEVAANDSRQQTIGILQVAAFLATAIAFLIWIHRAHRNVPALGATDLKYSSRWAVGGFFVPFVNLVHPFQVVKEIWRVSDPASLNGTNDTKTPPIVGWWWGLFLVSGFFSSAVDPMVRHGAEKLSDVISASWLMLFSDVLAVPPAILAILVVRTIDQMQEESYRQILIRGPSQEIAAEKANVAKDLKALAELYRTQGKLADAERLEKRARETVSNQER